MQGALLEVAERSDPGRDPDKQVNEDSAAQKVTPLGHLLVVCDGMGGHALGQEASRLAVGTIIQYLDAAPPGAPPGPSLAAAVALAGRQVFDLGGAHPHAGRPGSTCVALLVHAGAVEVAHVGDSRAYFIRGGRIWPLTKDHSVVQQMVDQGALTPEQASVHPEANKITRALGMKPDTDVELRDPPLLHAAGDIFVLASDGLCDLVLTDEIGNIILQGPTLDAACQNLVTMANARGGHDNITVLVARASAGGGSALKASGEGVAPTIVQTQLRAMSSLPAAAPSGAPQQAHPLPGSGPQQAHPVPSGAPQQAHPLPGSGPQQAHPAQGAHAVQGAPEKTLVDLVAPVVPPHAPFTPNQPAVPFVPNSPQPAPSFTPGSTSGQVTAPIMIGHVPGAPYGAPPPAHPATIPPAPPSHGKVLVIVLALVGLILAGVLGWAILRFR